MTEQTEETIPARIVHVDSLLQAEHAENEIRKDFTPSERVAIAKAIEDELGNRQGQRTDKVSAELPQNFAEVAGKETRQIAAEKAGFGNAETYRQAKTVVKEAVPELVAAMDRGEISISAAAMARLRCERKDCGIEGANPDARFGRWCDENFNTPESRFTIRNARRLWEVFGDRREEVAFIPQSGLYALAEPHPVFPDKRPVEINRPFISMAGIADSGFILECRDIQISSSIKQLRGMSR